MKYVATLLAVQDMERSKRFYHDVLGLEVTGDFGANVTLTGGISLQTADSWKGFIHKQDEDLIFKNNVSELYFETDDIDQFAKELAQRGDIEYIHPLIEHSWGQKAIRFYDPDKHILEVGENLNSVVKKFLDSGLSVEETALRMDVPVSFIQSCIGNWD
jgi:catechol 2,3-dioxygenase-like lactoylglutathione lyase family enzyme